MDAHYSNPTALLLNYGDAEKIHNADDANGWPNYVKECDFQLKDVSDICRLMKASYFYEVDDNENYDWACIHAWRTLGQLQAVEAAPNLIDLIDTKDEDEDAGDWAFDEIPVVLSMMGPGVYTTLVTYLLPITKGHDGFIIVLEALKVLVEKHPDIREKCISDITDKLTGYSQHELLLNGFLVSFLIDLNAIESLDIIREAFDNGCVDTWVAGDREDVEIAFGVRETRDTPPPQFIEEGIDMTDLNTTLDANEDTNSAIDHSDCHTGCGHDHKGTPIINHVKTGRNDPCTCGSGKKYKKCCL